MGVCIGMDESSASARMNQYEKGKHTPDISTLKAIANELGVPLHYFFCEDEVSAELAITFNQLYESDRSKILELAHKLLNNSNQHLT